MTCPAPDCEEKATREYDGPHGNTILLCEEHYYRTVTGHRVVSRVVERGDRKPEPIWKHFVGGKSA